LVDLYDLQGIHNVNFVTPDQFFPHTVAIVRSLHNRGVALPIVYNLSGYQSTASLRFIEPVADIYLPDFKYADGALAQALSKAPDYARVALDAISEMVRQKGFLSLADTEDHPGGKGPTAPSRVAEKGVLVRHLILPGSVQNSIDALTMLFVEFGRELPLSLMSQYTPTRRSHRDPLLSGRVKREEFRSILTHAAELGFEHMYVQYPENGESETDPFLPDFRAPNPFPGNRSAS
jgi:putative pyruvate formate lyase activating enzyme